MKEQLLIGAYTFIRLYIGSGLFDRMSTLVQHLSKAATMPGAEKKQAVIDFLVSEGATLSGIFLDLVIAIVRARFERAA